jgi:hypothetical protein
MAKPHSQLKPYDNERSTTTDADGKISTDILA